MKIGKYGSPTTLWSNGFEVWSQWTAQIVSGTYNWAQSSSGTSPTCTPHGGTYMAYYNSYSASSGYQARLYSGNLSYNNANMKLRFWMFHDTGYLTNAETIAVQVSTNGVNWVTLATFYRSTQLQGLPAVNQWVQHQVSLGAYGTSPTLRIGFLATSQFGDNMFIDDASLIDPGLIYIYNQNVTVSLNSGQTTTVNFPAWTNTDWLNATTQGTNIDYDCIATSMLANDSDPSNNVTVKTVTLYYPYLHDFAVTAITSPVSGTGSGSIIPAATVQNLGQNNETNVPVNMRIKTNGTLWANGFEVWSTWTAVILSGSYNWIQASSGTSPTCSPHSGTYMAEYQSYSASTGSARVYSGILNYNNANMNLMFWMYHDTGYLTTADTVTVQVSTNGVNWVNLTTYYRSTQLQGLPAVNGWYQHSVSLGSYGASPTLRIAFLATSAYGDNMFIDDASLFDSTLGTVVYNQNVNVSLTAGQTMSVNFPAWTNTAWNNASIQGVNIVYDCKATSMLTGDLAPSNNVTVKTVTLNYPFLHDVTVTAITSPVSGNARPLPVSLTIQNIGQNSERGFFIKAQIKTSTLVLEFDELAAVATWMAPGETRTFNYGNWTPAGIAAGISGDIGYSAIGTTLLANDTHTANDQRYSNFTLHYFHDVSVSAITSPSLKALSLKAVLYKAIGPQSIAATVVDLGTFPESGLNRYLRS